MKTYKTFCDCCGREIIKEKPTIPWSKYPFYDGSLHLHIKKWGGGSMGGTEDLFDYECEELCAECAMKLEQFVTGMCIKKKKYK